MLFVAEVQEANDGRQHGSVSRRTAAGGGGGRGGGGGEKSDGG